MSGSSQQPVVTQTQNQAPWSGAQPYLQQLYGTAAGMAAANIGYQPYGGPTVAPLDPNLNQGLSNIINTASGMQTGGVPGLGGAQDFAANLVGQQGITPQLQNALGGLGTAAGQYGQIYGAAQGAANPYLQQVIDEQNLRGNAAIQSSMSGAGRYGSGQYADVMARAQAQVADPLLMQDYEARQARALQATQGLGQTYGQQAGILQQGIGQAGQMAGMIPQLAQAQYLPGQMMVSAADYMQGRAQQDLQGQIQFFNATQALPWQQQERLGAILAGAGQLGGTTVTSQTPLQPSLSARLAGGALVGAGLGSAIPGLGTGLGAGAGALAGAFL